MQLQIDVVYLTQMLNAADNTYPVTEPLRAVVARAYNEHYRGQPHSAIDWNSVVVTNIKGQDYSWDTKLTEVDFAGVNKLLVVLKQDGGGGATPPSVLLDPRVACKKVEEQFALIREAAPGRGWIIHVLEYPDAVIEVISRVGVKIECLNYDFVPPSFTIVDPTTRAVLSHAEVLNRAHRQGQGISYFLHQHPVTKSPFFCVQGFWEYHEHPSHFNDPWLLYRTKFSLFSRLDLVDRLLRGKQLGQRGV